ncbi:12411_t:CDS:1, partial [Cetraspora pellucida]
SLNEYLYLALQIFNEIIDEYLLFLSDKKSSKALILENIANKYLQILNNSQDIHIANSNMHYQVKNNYSCQRVGGIVTLMHKEKLNT